MARVSSSVSFLAALSLISSTVMPGYAWAADKTVAASDTLHAVYTHSTESVSSPSVTTHNLTRTDTFTFNTQPPKPQRLVTQPPKPEKYASAKPEKPDDTNAQSTSPEPAAPQPATPAPAARGPNLMPAGVSGLQIAGAVALGAGLVTAAVAGSGGGGDDNGGSSGGGGGGNTAQEGFGRTMLPQIATPASFLTADMTTYKLGGLQKENAHYAYAQGLTGEGVKLGIYDFFSDDATTNTKVNARVIYRDLNVLADNAFLAAGCLASGGDPEACDHGGAVMGYAANARDGNGSQGMAYKADLMLSSVLASNSLLTLADQDPDIINFSCGGCATNSELNTLKDKGILMVAATGNDDGFNPNPASPASIASTLDYHMIAVTGVYETSGGDLTAMGYDRCGNQKEYCLSAYSNSGTSFAAPQVAGAAALLKDGWSFLTAKQIAQILLFSAKDIGATGVDGVFGRGLLDLKAATEPVGAAVIANGSGNLIPVSPMNIAMNQSSPFGDAFSNTRNAKGDIIVTDAFGRDFKMAARDNVIVAKNRALSPTSLRLLGHKPAMRKMQFNDAMTMRYSTSQNPETGTTDFSGMAHYTAGNGLSFKTGLATDIAQLETDDIFGFDRHTFISNSLFRNGFTQLSDNNQVMYQAVELQRGNALKTRFSTTYSRQSEDNYFRPAQRTITSDYVSSMVETIVQPVTNFWLNIKTGMTHEPNSVLGTQFSGGFDMADGSDTYFSGVDMSYDMTSDINLSASYTYGVTNASPSSRSAFSNVSDIVSDSFFVTATKKNLVGNDSMSLSVGQPTRVRSGYATGVTQAVDPQTGAARLTNFQHDLTPGGRTLLFQAAYDKTLNDSMAVNLAFEYAHQPYQQKEMSDEAAALAKFVYKFN